MITLLSDWKLRDPYVGIFKGELLKSMPDVKIVDITHNLELLNLAQTAFIAKNSFSFFPEKTVHIILTGLSFSLETKPVLIIHKGHFFLGEDTGVFSMMFGTDQKIEAYQYNGDMALSATGKLASMAKSVVQNKFAEEMAPYQALKFQLSNLSEPDNSNPNIISGKIAYIDSYCNAITNIPISMFEAAGKRGFTATVSSTRSIKIKSCYPNYNPRESDLFFVYNCLGVLEIALYNGNIAALADIKVGDSVEIKFE